MFASSARKTLNEQYGDKKNPPFCLTNVGLAYKLFYHVLFKKSFLEEYVGLCGPKNCLEFLEISQDIPESQKNMFLQVPSWEGL